MYTMEELEISQILKPSQFILKLFYYLARGSGQAPSRGWTTINCQYGGKRRDGKRGATSVVGTRALCCREFHKSKSACVMFYSLPYL